MTVGFSHRKGEVGVGGVYEGVILVRKLGEKQYAYLVPLFSHVPSLYPTHMHRNTTRLPQSRQGGREGEQVSTELSKMPQTLSL